MSKYSGLLLRLFYSSLFLFSFLCTDNESIAQFSILNRKKEVNEQFLEEKLNNVMEAASKPKGDVIGKYSFPVSFDYPNKGVRAVNVGLEQISEPTGGLRIVVMPEERAWNENICLNKVVVYLLSRNRSRYEIEEHSVIRNRQENVVYYAPVEYEGGFEDELIIDRSMKAVYAVLKKLGIAKEDLIDMVKALGYDIVDVIERPYERQRALETGSLITQDHVYFKRIEYFGLWPHTDMISLKESKLYDLTVWEGEKAIDVLGISVSLYNYKPVFIGGMLIFDYGSASSTADVFIDFRDFKKLIRRY